MTKTNKTILGIIVVAIAIVILWSAFGRKSAEETAPEVKESVKIGVILMLSGKTADYGEKAQRGFALALEDIKTQVPQWDINLFYEDSKNEAAGALSAFRKLRDINNARIMIVMGSVSAMATAPLANQEQVLQMAITASTPQYTSPNDFTFRTTPRAEVEDKELAKAVVAEYKKIALLYNNDERGMGHRDAIKPEIERLGGEVVAEEAIPVDDVDFRTQLTKIKDKKPEAIYLLAEAKNAGLVLKQAEELEISAQWFATRSIQKKEFLEIAGETAEGIIYTYSFDVESANPLVKSFVERYKNKYGEIPDYVVAEAYDGLILITQALNWCGKIDTGCMKEYLFGVKDYRALSGNLTFDENGDVYYPYTLKTVKNGKFLPYEE